MERYFQGTLVGEKLTKFSPVKLELIKYFNLSRLNTNTSLSRLNGIILIYLKKILILKGLEILKVVNKIFCMWAQFILYDYTVCVLHNASNSEELTILW